MNKLIVQDAVFEQKTEWIICTNSDRLYQRDLDTGELKVLCRIPLTGKQIERPFGCIIKNGDDLLISPYLAHCLWIYNLHRQELISIDLSDKDEAFYIQAAYIYNEYIYMLSYSKSSIIKLNLRNHKKEEVRIPDLKEKQGSYGDSKQVDDSIFLLVKDEPRIIEYNLVENIFKTYDVECSHKGFITMAFDGTFFWLTGKGKDLVQWNKAFRKTEGIFQLPDDLECFEYDASISDLRWYNKEFFGEESLIPFSRSFYIDKHIVLIPFRANCILAFDLDKMEFKKVLIDNEQENYRKIGGYDAGWFRLKHKYLVEGIDQEKKLHIFSIKRRMTYIIEPCTLTVTEDSWNMDGHCNYQYLSGYYNEENSRDLLDYLRVEYGPANIMEDKRNSSLVGQQIWDISS